MEERSPSRNSKETPMISDGDRNGVPPGLDGRRGLTPLVVGVAILVVASAAVSAVVVYQSTVRPSSSSSGSVEISSLAISVSYKAGSPHLLKSGNGCLHLNCPFSINATSSPDGTEEGGFQFWVDSTSSQFGQANITGISSPFTFTLVPQPIAIFPGQASDMGIVFVTCSHAGSFPVTVYIVE